MSPSSCFVTCWQHSTLLLLMLTMTSSLPDWTKHEQFIKHHFSGLNHTSQEEIKQYYHHGQATSYNASNLVHQTPLQWFKSYLSRRNQTILSSWSGNIIQCIQFSCPQGSVMGRILFSLYVADIGSSLSVTAFPVTSMILR